MRDLKLTQNLDNYIGAYGEDFDFSFDNEIILNWYPERIKSLTSSKSRVLELGIGHGYTCNHFSEYYREYSVIDGSSAVIEQFRSQFPKNKANIIEGYFENFDSQPLFDVIIMGFVLEHVDSPLEILSMYRKFLAPGGCCFVAVPNAESLHRRFGHAAGLLKDMAILSSGDIALGHQRLYTVESLTAELESCNYTVSHVEGIFLKPLMTTQLKSLDLSEDILQGMCQVGVDYPELSAGFLFQASADE